MFQGLQYQQRRDAVKYYPPEYYCSGMHQSSWLPASRIKELSPCSRRINENTNTYRDADAGRRMFSAHKLQRHTNTASEAL